MKLNLDMPKHKWQCLNKYLKQYRKEDETVNIFCNAVETIEFGSDFPLKMYNFLSSHSEFNPLIFPTAQNIAKANGGAGILKNMYQIYEHISQARNDYYVYIQKHFKIMQK